MTYSIFDVLQLIGGGIICIGYLPQIWKVLRTKSVEDLSLGAFLTISVGVFFMEFYGIDLVLSYNMGHAFLITNTLNLMLGVTLCLSIIYYRKKEN